MALMDAHRPAASDDAGAVLRCTLPAPIIAWWEAWAQWHGRAADDVLRAALERYLDRHVEPAWPAAP